MLGVGWVFDLIRFVCKDSIEKSHGRTITEGESVQGGSVIVMDNPLQIQQKPEVKDCHFNAITRGYVLVVSEADSNHTIRNQKKRFKVLQGR